MECARQSEAATALWINENQSGVALRLAPQSKDRPFVHIWIAFDSLRRNLCNLWIKWQLFSAAVEHQPRSRRSLFLVRSPWRRQCPAQVV